MQKSQRCNKSSRKRIGVSKMRVASTTAEASSPEMTSILSPTLKNTSSRHIVNEPIPGYPKRKRMRVYNNKHVQRNEEIV